MTAPRALMTVAAALALSGVAEPASAQRLDLSIVPGTIVIPNADPDTMPVLASAPVSVNYRVRQNTRQVWLLTVEAGGDLVSGPSTIDIAAVTWTASPSPPFQSGTLSRTGAQTVASGTGNVPSPSVGSLTFRLANSWTYDAGTYTQTLVFTLSTP